VLFLHETHNVVGARHDEFEAAYREGWMPTLANEDNARLLWYANQAHGSGRSYTVVTITGIADGASWESLARRTQQGDLRPWMRELDNLRHEVTGKLLLPVAWSPLQSVDLATVPTDAATHPLSLFMEDTGWPYAALDDYIRSWDEIYYRVLSQAPARMRILEGRRRQVEERREGLRDAIARASNSLDRYTRQLHQLGLESSEREVKWLNELIAAERAAPGLTEQI